MKKLKYSLKDGIIIGIGYSEIFEFEVTEDTPFQSISESENWRFLNGKWERYDSTWHFNFKYRVTIPANVILDNEFYTALIGNVKELIKIGRAAQEVTEDNRILYFADILPEHMEILKNDINVKIELNEKFI